jgi:hypothetical protein
MHWGSITQDLAGQVVKKLLETLHEGGPKGASK